VNPADVDDEELRLWVLNDEYLYLWSVREGVAEDDEAALDAFVADHRAELTAYVQKMLSRKPRKPV
jgi:hypothetical protein